MRLLTGVDRSPLVVYCEMVAEFEEAIAILQTKGRTMRTANGGLQARPEVAMVHRAALLIRAFASEFGLTPSARTRLGTIDEAGADDGLGILS